MTRQYIGARYVPRFRGTYDATTEYEGLDVVDNGVGTSYIARKTVPAGTALTNTEYWFVYGASSGAILDLQSRMTTAEGDIDDLERDLGKLGDDDIYARLHNKKIIVLGDSLTIGTGSALGHTWVEKLAAKYGADVSNEGVSGSPIGGTDPDSFYARITGILADNPTCDIFVISGGANDKNRNIRPGSAKTTSTNTTSGALKYIINAVRTKYGKDCRILCMTTYHRYDDYNNLGYCEYDYVQTVLNSAAQLGVPCFNNYDNCGLSLIDLGSANAWSDVGFVDSTIRNYHFSEDAYDYLMPIYAAYLATGYANCSAISPNYLNDTDNHVYVYRGNNQDGFGKVYYRKSQVSFAINDFGGHIAIFGGTVFQIPKEFALKDVLNMDARIVCDSWNVSTAITGYSINSDESINVVVSGVCIYGTTAPTSPQTCTVFINLGGILA